PPTFRGCASCWWQPSKRCHPIRVSATAPTCTTTSRRPCRCPSCSDHLVAAPASAAQARELVVAPLGLVARPGIGQLLLSATKLDPADLARDRLGKLEELD